MAILIKEYDQIPLKLLKKYSAFILTKLNFNSQNIRKCLSKEAQHLNWKLLFNLKKKVKIFFLHFNFKEKKVPTVKPNIFKIIPKKPKRPNKIKAIELNVMEHPGQIPETPEERAKIVKKS